MTEIKTSEGTLMVYKTHGGKLGIQYTPDDPQLPQELITMNYLQAQSLSIAIQKENL